MRTTTFVLTALIAACSNSPDPRVIHGGGIGDGEIDGTLNVYVIDHDTEPRRAAGDRRADRAGLRDLRRLLRHGLQPRRRSRQAHGPVVAAGDRPLAPTGAMAICLLLTA